MKKTTRYTAFFLCFTLSLLSFSPSSGYGAELPTVWEAEDEESSASSGSGSDFGNPFSDAAAQPAEMPSDSGTTDAEAPDETAADAPSSYAGSSSYEQWFTDQCLAYINSNEYTNNIMGIPGAEAGMIADSFKDSNLAAWNDIWQTVAAGMNMVGGEEIRLEDPVELIIPEMMVKTLTGDEFENLFTASYLRAMEELFGGLGDLASADETKYLLDIILEGSPSFIAYSVNVMQTYRESFETFGMLGRSSEFIKVQETFVTEVDNRLKHAFSFEITDEAAQQIKAWWNLGDTVLDIGGATFYDLLRAKAMYDAYQHTSDSWLQFWTMVMAEAAVESGAGYHRLFYLSKTGDIAEEIEKNLKDFQTANESKAFSFSYFLSTTAEHSALVLVEEGTELIFNLLHDALPQGSRLKAVMDATKYTHKLINYLTNMDDTTYYGQLAFSSSELARCAAFALSLSAEELRSAGTFESAVRFNDTFHYFKELELLALDYTISYDNSITEAALYSIATRLTSINPQYGVWPWTHDVPENYGKKKELELLRSIRGIWASRDCLLDSQFHLIEQYHNLWDPLQDPDSYTNYYSMAVTDINCNGRLEVTVAWTMGSGRFSEFRMYEINSDLTGLEACPIDTEKFQPDLGWDEAVDVCKTNGQYWVVFRDFIRGGWASNATVQEALCLKEGGIDARVLGVQTVNVSQQGSDYIETVTYTDDQDRDITEEQYNNILSYKFPDAETGKMTFRWIPNEDLEKSPYFYIRNSWEGFGCDLF